RKARHRAAPSPSPRSARRARRPSCPGSTARARRRRWRPRPRPPRAPATGPRARPSLSRCRTRRVRTALRSPRSPPYRLRFRLELGREPIEQIAVGVRVDLTGEDPLGAGDRDRGDLRAQLVPCAIHLDLDLGACALEPTLLLGLALGLRRFDDLVRARLRLVEDAAGLLTCGVDDLLGLGLRVRESHLAPLGGREAVGDRDL